MDKTIHRSNCYTKMMRFQKPEWHDELPSTNTTLVEWLREGRDLPDGFVLAARSQTAGRGRYERQWLARPGRNLTFSALLQTAASPLQFLSLPQAARPWAWLAYLEENGLAAQTKWPNDVLVGDRKYLPVSLRIETGTERDGRALQWGRPRHRPQRQHGCR